MHRRSLILDKVQMQKTSGYVSLGKRGRLYKATNLGVISLQRNTEINEMCEALNTQKAGVDHEVRDSVTQLCSIPGQWLATASCLNLVCALTTLIRTQVKGL